MDTSSPSSPDPLALSGGPSSSPTKRLALRNRQRTPLSSKSANLQQENDVFATPRFSRRSPTKSITMSTGKARGASPWKIKVTVEAEPQSQDESDASVPRGRTRSTMATKPTTRTITVPLKGGEDSSPIQSKATRKKTKRSGTPVRRRRTRVSIGDHPSDDEDVDPDFSPAKVEKKRGRPHKSGSSPSKAVAKHQPGTSEDKPDPATDDDEKMDKTPTRPSTTQNRQARNVVRASVPAQSTRPSAFNFANLTPLHAKHTLPDRFAELAAWQEEQASLPTPEATRRLRNRVPTPVKPKAHVANLGSSLTDLSHEEDSEVRGRFDHHRMPTPRKPTTTTTSLVATHSAVAQEEQMWRETRGERGQTAEISTEGSDHADEEDDQVGNIGDETMLQSEEFSMVSLESLPGMRETLGSPSNGRQKMTAPNHQPQKVTITSSETSQPPQLTPGSRRTQSVSQNITPSLVNQSPPMQIVSEYTPFVVPSSPAEPPVIEAPKLSPQKPSSPEMAQVMKAGRALQTAFDSTRDNSQSSSRVGNRRSFDEGAQRAFQASVKLREEIEKSSPMHSYSKRRNTQSAPVELSSPAKPVDDVFEGSGKSTVKDVTYPRLPTPEDYETYMLTVPQPRSSEADTQHTNLTVPDSRKQLASPARSVDDVEMSGLSPQSQPAQASSSRPGSERKNHVTPVKRKAAVHDSSPLQEEVEVAEEKWQLAREAVMRQMQLSNTSQVPDEEEEADEQAEYDIWDEASRTPGNIHSSPPVKKGFVPRDLSIHDSSMMLPQEKNPQLGPQRAPMLRRKPRKSRRRTEDHLDSSLPDAGPFVAGNLITDDSSFLRPGPRSHATRSSPSASKQVTFSDAVEQAPPLRRNASGETDASLTDASESSTDGGDVATPDEDEAEDSENDTGNFFQSNLPTVFKGGATGWRQRRQEREAQKSQEEAERFDLSMLSSPAKEKTPMKSPLKNVPRLEAGRGNVSRFSPARASPLRRQLSSPSEVVEHSIESVEESFIQSRSIDDTEASDVRQLRTEARSTGAGADQSFEDIDDSDVRQLRAESAIVRPEDNSGYGDSTVMDETDVFSPSSLLQRSEATYDPVSPTRSSLHREVSKRPSRVLVPQRAPPAQPGLVSRLTSSIWSAFTTPTTTAPAYTRPTHYLLHKLPLLPKVEPWTRLHYRVMDHLYQRLKMNPSIFDPDRDDIIEAKALSPKEDYEQYFGMQIENWGYHVEITPQAMVLIGLFMSLLQLPDITAYEQLYEKKIDKGSCKPRPDGTVIDLRECVGRMFSMVAGEGIRADEREGRRVRREVGSRVMWGGTDEWVGAIF
ncbi:hypothetical protein K402DRAFT_454461 [Aulographum hederae CBS 113979]|uniref:Uncharacterized protein n=1 Tax=Aulographum hederae CBS 113979 TaxID=1176131 RepID=A0A6G1GYR4_9PEZI|nr:hypothetical protein K402DRAFT_454461 [Aulographum hederae CBS 113979]